MSDYSELVKHSRRLATESHIVFAGILLDLADAVESLQAECDRANDELAVLQQVYESASDNATTFEIERDALRAKPTKVVRAGNAMRGYVPTHTEGGHYVVRNWQEVTKDIER